MKPCIKDMMISLFILDMVYRGLCYVANAFTNYLSMINFHDKNISVNYRETNSIQSRMFMKEKQILKFAFLLMKRVIHLLETKE